MLPSIIGLVITSVDTIGDVTATEEASLLDVEGPEHDQCVGGKCMHCVVGCVCFVFHKNV